MKADQIVEIARKALEADKERREQACADELRILLERHNCKIEVVPERVAGLWTFRMVIESK